MIKKKCNECGTLHQADHADACNVCAESNLVFICEKHLKLAVSPLALACPYCKETARLNSLCGGGEKGQRSDELLRALKTCVIYLISLDTKFSSKEQKWVDKNFGEGVADNIIQTLSVIDWDKHFKTLDAQLSALSDVDKKYMLISANPLFLELLLLDDLTNIEFERLQHLMDFIGENLAD
ncbi:hypothetical protein OAJ79_04365 [Verrucomicrobia bacterium]|mgnify:CR=1 FL=1|nr:hypothetical protein [Verrucomicrobiota bacterium]